MKQKKKKKKKTYLSGVGRVDDDVVQCVSCRRRLRITNESLIIEQ
jgi:hypothetical protein